MKYCLLSSNNSTFNCHNLKIFTKWILLLAILLFISKFSYSQSSRTLTKIIKACVQYDNTTFKKGDKINKAITRFSDDRHFKLKNFNDAQNTYIHDFKDSLFSKADYNCFLHQIKDTTPYLINPKKIIFFSKSSEKYYEGKTITFTEPIYYCNKQKLFISYSYYCGVRCGEGKTLLLVKKNKRWKVKAEIWGFVS